MKYAVSQWARASITTATVRRRASTALISSNQEVFKGAVRATSQEEKIHVNIERKTLGDHFSFYCQQPEAALSFCCGCNGVCAFL